MFYALYKFLGWEFRLPFFERRLCYFLPIFFTVAYSPMQFGFASQVQLTAFIYSKVYPTFFNLKVLEILYLLDSKHPRFFMVAVLKVRGGA